MKKLFTYLIIICSISVTAQNAMTYNIIKENTDIKFISGKIAVWDVLISSSRMTFAGGFGGKIYLNGLFAGANYNFHYLDNLAEASSSNTMQGSSIYNSTKSRDADLTLGYFFQKKTKGKIRINLKQQGKITYYTKVDAEFNKIIGLQATYKSGFSHLTIPSGVAVKDYYIPESGTITTQQGMTTFMKYGWISFGPSYGKTVDVAANFEGIGERKTEFFQRFYANVILGTSSKLEDVYYTEGFGSSNPLVHRYVLNGNVVMSKTGFNVGYETYKFRGVGIGYGIEAGLMPGVKLKDAGNGYLVVKWGIVFGKMFGGK